MITRALRWWIWLVLVGITLVWAVSFQFAPGWIDQRLSPQEKDKLSEVIEQSKEIDPNVANQVEAIKDNRERRALAIVLRAEQLRPHGNVDQMANRLTQSPGPYELELARLASDPTLLRDDHQRQEFLLAHTTTLELLHDPSPTGAQLGVTEYLRLLTTASHTPDEWNETRRDPVAMLVFQEVADRSQREFYLREKNDSQHPDWLNVVLVQLTGLTLETSAKALSISSVLQVARDNHPYFKDAIAGEGLDAAAVYSLFFNYGNVVRLAVGPTVKLPLSEVLEVLFANDGFFDGHVRPEDDVALLVQVHNAKPAVWQEARRSPLALRLNKDAPRDADKVLKDYGADDVASLLYASYEEAIPQAATSVVRFGDLAIYLLGKYAEEELEPGGKRPFHDALRKDGIGPRLIPYVAKFTDPGLSRLTDSSAWLDKYFDIDGTPKEPEWWTTIPGGAALSVARNCANGYPNEWSELGWAALDVADAALMVASFGASEVVEGPVDAAARHVAKKTIVQEVRQRAPQLGKGLRKAARVERESLLRKAIIQTGEIGGKALSRTWRMLEAAKRATVRPAYQVFQQAQKLNAAWKNVSAATRRLVYRGLLASGLFMTLTERTLPNLEKIGDAAGALVGQIMKKGIEAATHFLIQAIREILGSPSHAQPVWIGSLVWLVGLLLLCLISYVSYPRRKRARYV